MKDMFKKGSQLYQEIAMTTNVLPITEILGNRRVLIENHKGIKGYNPECIRVCVPKGYILIKGCCLCVSVMTRYRLVITGNIHSVQFFDGGDLV